MLLPAERCCWCCCPPNGEDVGCCGPPVKALREASYPCLESDVLGVDLPHSPGSLARVARALAGAGINIDFAYSGPGRETGRAGVVMAVSDLERAEKLV